MAAKTKGNNLLSLHTFCLITGASKGLGRAMALRFGAELPPNSIMVLMARSADLLEKTKALILEKSPLLEVKIVPVDLSISSKQYLEQKLLTIFEEIGMKPTDFYQGMVVHNAASLGDVSKKLQDIDDSESLVKYYNLNVCSPVVLNSIFLQLFHPVVPVRTVINISSICALQPFKSWSLYCSAKSARDMLFRTMALEDPDIRILNYAPGPLDTDMQVEARANTGDAEIKKIFIDMKSQSKLLTCDQSIDKLMGLLKANTFDSGAHIDYYDI